MPCWAPAQFGRFEVINKKEKESASMDERTARATYQPCYIFSESPLCGDYGGITEENEPAPLSRTHRPFIAVKRKSIEFDARKHGDGLAKVY
jgi:hypothetical protein